MGPNALASPSIAFLVCLSLLFSTSNATSDCLGSCPVSFNVQALTACLLHHVNDNPHPTKGCCYLMRGLRNVDAAVCLCKALKLLDTDVVVIPGDLKALFTTCDPDFRCNDPCPSD